MPLPTEPRYCPGCGAELRRAVPAGDDRERAVCPRCDEVHFVNPKVVVGCIVEHGDQLLLCRRAIEPGHGSWTVPGGFLELSETLVDGARRETREEAQAEVEVIAPHVFFDLPHIGQVYALFRARLLDGGFAPGPESLEVALFDLDDLPYEGLAFPVVHRALELYVQDRRADRHHVHHGAIVWNGTGSRFEAANCDLRGHIKVPLR